MGIVVLQSAYSAMSRFLVLHRMMPMLADRHDAETKQSRVASLSQVVSRVCRKLS
jgi:hypothetical protein